MTTDDIQKILSSEEASWVFDHNITWEDDIWKADPFDSPEIHSDAREKFETLLTSITGETTQGLSRILMFQGQSGAGKTHLIRALRTRAHTAVQGYFGYAQMTPDVSNYAEYFLRRLINSLEKPYAPENPSESGLKRLSNRLAEDAGVLSDKELEKLRESELEADGLAVLINDLADTVVVSEAFVNQELDINIVRALLYLQRNDPRIDQRIRQYLYGRPLNELSRQSVAALDPNDGQDRAFEIIESLGRIMHTADGAALIFCIDQVEDLRFYDDPEERFQKAVRDLIQIANRVPSAIILISCLDDFYFQMREFLPQSFIDRIEKTRPILLRGARTSDEAKLILGKRLQFVANNDNQDGNQEITDPQEVFGAEFFDDIAGLSTRRLLEAAETKRRELCLGEGTSSTQSSEQGFQPTDQFSINTIQQRWERFVLDYQAEIPAEDEEFISVLTSALHLTLGETDFVSSLRIQPIASLDGISAVDLAVTHANGHVYDSRLFICNLRSQGGGLKRQIEKVTVSTDGKAPMILRSSDFPRNKRSITGEHLAQFVAEGGKRLVIPTYEWERMVTLQEFCGLHQHESGFRGWLKAAQILRDLPAVQKLLHLDTEKDPASEQAGQPSPMPVPSAIQPLSEPDTPTNVHHVDFGARSNGSVAQMTAESVVPAPAQQPVKPPSLIERLFGYTPQYNSLKAPMDSQLGEAALDAMPPLADAYPQQGHAEQPGSLLDAVPAHDERQALNSGPQYHANSIRVGRALGTVDEEISFDLNLLRRHAAVLGGSGSGKTTLALNIIEQLLLHDIPVVLIDRKGDLASYANPGVWDDDPRDPPERRARRAKLREKIDVAVYTPGRISGRPISITLLPNGIADLPVHEQQQLANVSAAALSDMLHLGNSATHQRQCGILTVGLRQLGSMSAREVTLADLIGLLEDDYTDLVDETQRMDPSGKLRRDLVAQLDSLRHRNWALFEGGGEPLSMDSLLGKGKKANADKTRLSIVYTGFLGDNENILFWVAQFLTEALRFCQKNPHEDLQAVIMFDEADLYIPANAKPATKEPLESLLKRARSAGIGLMLATQSPGDLDYKSRDQITSWFIGKVREDTALKKLKAAFSSETGIDPASALPNQKVGEFHMIQEGIVKAIMADKSLVIAEQVPFDRIEDLSSGTSTKKPKKQLLFDFQ